MERMKASDFPQEVLNIFDLYIHGHIDRRGFLDRAQKYAVGGFTAAVMLEMLRPNWALGQQVPKDDPRLRITTVEIPSPQGNGTIKAYVTRPAKATGKLPVVLVVHENRGLNPHIEDIARRVGLANFLAIAPDGLTTVGGYPGDETKATQLFGTVNGMKMTEDFVAAEGYAKANPEGTGKVGVVGFCYGGGIVNTLAVRIPDLNCGVAYYGNQPTAPADIAKIKAPLLLHYGSLDAGITGRWPAYDAALTAAGVVHTGYVYEGANHGFNNDTGARYDEKAAKLSWQRTMDFFEKYLR
jgi:carboxymethylenebutenolidase